METRYTECRECSGKIIGRTDKKFCSDLCRNSYNNRQESSANKKISLINITLKRNRRILEELMNKKIRKVTLEALLLKGFNHNYITNFEYNKDRICCYFCYEYGYYAVENDCYKLVKNSNSIV